jgi:hypothetical protein
MAKPARALEIKRPWAKTTKLTDFAKIGYPDSRFMRAVDHGSGNVDAGFVAIKGEDKVAEATHGNEG